MRRRNTNISLTTRAARRSKLSRLLETSSERELRLARVREHNREKRARETSADRLPRLARERANHASLRKRERARILYSLRKQREQEGVQRITRAQNRKPREKIAQRNALVESSPGHYKPTLWYYKHMNFLSGNTDPDSDDSDSDHNDVDTLYVQLPRVRKRSATTSLDQQVGGLETIDASAAAFGRSVGAQLHHLSKMQRCIAEKLISDVIYHAKMEQLSLDTSINVKENLDDSLTLMSEADPSLDTGTALSTSACEQEPTSSTELTAEELVQREIAETESAVSFIKMEESDTDNYFFHDVDEQNDEIDIGKEELI